MVKAMKKRDMKSYFKDISKFSNTYQNHLERLSRLTYDNRIYGSRGILFL